MFTLEDIHARFKAQPFEPTQIVLSTGQTCDVRHPDLVWLTRRYMLVGVPVPGFPGVADNSTQIAYLHIAEFRNLPPQLPSGATGRGEAGRGDPPQRTGLTLGCRGPSADRHRSDPHHLGPGAQPQR